MSRSSLTLSQKLRADASREVNSNNNRNVNNHQHHLTRESISNSNTTSYYGKTLPTIANSSHRSFPEAFEHLSPTFRKTTVNRLAGLSDNVNSSGLYSDNHFPRTISSLCVRCGLSAALCMTCAEQDCEDALTFYRKTRAAGAATLFNKAFVEAGFRKTLKFTIFRILKNSVQAKLRERMKKKMIVEKLFGTNLVYLPFNAWRRYTKENIVRRKNKSIEQLSAQIELLEGQLKKLSSNLSNLTKENEQLQSTIVQNNITIQEQAEKIMHLEQDNEQQRQRVKGLSHLVIPLMNYSTALESITQQKIVETNRFLQKAATFTTSYNYGHLFEDTLFDQLYQKLREKKRKETYAPKLTNVNLPSKQLQTGHNIVLTWLHSVSLHANDFIESTTGQSLNFYLPAHATVETLSDLRNGRLLCRAIVAIIYDRRQLRQQAEEGIVQINASYYQLWTKHHLSLEDLEKIQALQSHTLELLSFLVSLTIIYLEMPAFKAIDLFSGKTDVLYNFVVGLMNASIPIVNKLEKDYFENKISTYYQIVNDIEEIKQERSATLATLFVDKSGAKKGTDMSNKPKKNLLTSIAEKEEEEKRESAHSKSKESKAENNEGDDEETNPSNDDNPDELSVELKPESCLEQLYDFFVDMNLQNYRKEYEEKMIAAERDEKTEGEDITIKTEATITNSHPGMHLTVNTSIDPYQRFKSSSDDHHSLGLEAFSRSTDSHQLLSGKIPKLSYSLQMSDQSYQQLCTLLDEFIVSPESAQVLEFSEKSFIISEKLAELQSAITLLRDHRDEGIRLTTDIRQFVNAQAMKLSFLQRDSEQQ